MTIVITLSFTGRHRLSSPGVRVCSTFGILPISKAWPSYVTRIKAFRQAVFILMRAKLSIPRRTQAFSTLRNSDGQFINSSTCDSVGVEADLVMSVANFSSEIRALWF